MSRLVVIIAVITVITSLEGLPIEKPMSYKDQAMETQDTHQDDANPQRLASVKVVRSAGDEVQASAGTIDVEQEVICTGILSREQVQDIQLQQSNQLYAIVDGQLIIMENHLDLYIHMHQIVSERHNNRSKDVWLSRAPCPDCVKFIEIIFNLFPVKPVLHVETLNFKGSNYEPLRDVGCLAKLKATSFTLKAWDWNVFGEKYGDSCDYLSPPLENTEYTTRKNYTKTLVDHVGGNQATSSLIKLCHS